MNTLIMDVDVVDIITKKSIAAAAATIMATATMA